MYENILDRINKGLEVKLDQELVVYKPEGPTTIYYKASLASYNRKTRNQYLKGLPENE